MHSILESYNTTQTAAELFPAGCCSPASCFYHSLRSLWRYHSCPLQAPFLRGVKLISSGDYSGSVEHMEEALRLYLHEYDLCQADCEGISQLSPDSDFYTIIVGQYAVFKTAEKEHQNEKVTLVSIRERPWKQQNFVLNKVQTLFSGMCPCSGWLVVENTFTLILPLSTFAFV